MLILLSMFLFCFKSSQCGYVQEIELKDHWNLSSVANGTCRSNLQVPSGVYSALFPEDPDYLLKSTNDVDMKWIAHENWTYSTCFNAPSRYTEVGFINLTFHGIDTVATIKLNDEILGHTNNMFVRYSYSIKELLKPTSNCVKVVFLSPIYAAKNLAAIHSYTPPECPPDRYNGECHINFLRKMQASFGWDWGLAAPSMGIWKPVVLELYDVAVLRDFDASAHKNKQTWTVHVRIYFETALKEDFCGELTLTPLDNVGQTIKVYYNNKNPIGHSKPMIEFDYRIPKDRVELWWPNGYGNQKLYDFLAIWRGRLCKDLNDNKGFKNSRKSIKIGFRTLELIQEELETGLSFYFRINEVPVFMKGTNWIPSHILPERQDNKQKVKHLLESAKNSHVNMIRIWGGGVYESEYFYELADYYGILVWQDMMFACAMYPTFPEFLSSVSTEVIQNARRIAHHPSIAVWGTNNEVEVALAQHWYNTSYDSKTFTTKYRDFFIGHVYFLLRSYVHSEILISSPSNGKKSVTEYFLSRNPQDPKYGDIHFYDYSASSDNWNPDTYPRPRFCSEYGFQSLPSFTSWQKIIGTNDDLTTLINHRQHYPTGTIPILNLLQKHFILPDENEENYLEAIIYMSQISQAMITKTATEVFRTNRNSSYQTMGALYWSLNDVWVAPSWSSIDFFGNYKISQYWAKEFMAPIIVVAHIDSNDYINIHVVRDTLGVTLFFTLTVRVYFWSSLSYTQPFEWRIPAYPNTASMVKIVGIDELLTRSSTKENSFFEFSLTRNGEMISRTYFFPSKIKDAVGIKDPKLEVNIVNNHCHLNTVMTSFTINVQKPAIFVYIEFTRMTTDFYKLSRNGYIQLNAIEMIYLEFQDENCTFPTKHEIKVLTVNQFARQNQ